MQQQASERFRRLWADPEWRAKAMLRARQRKDKDRGVCVYCGGGATTVDHDVPLSRGGSEDPENLVPACRPCNSAKGRLTGVEFRAVMAEAWYARERTA